jgi:redox-sensitive bicupin YhaK (pirin superfamily)
VKDGQLAVLGAGDSVELGASEGAELLLLDGKPLGEPVARYGPFVMTTREEILEAIADFRAGRMGAIPAEIARQ